MCCLLRTTIYSLLCTTSLFLMTESASFIYPLSFIGLEEVTPNFIPSENVTPNNGLILIYILIAILVIVLLSTSSVRMRIQHILDSDEDLKKREPKPIDLVYLNLTTDRGGSPPQPLIIDRNDPTGRKMMSIFPRKSRIRRGIYWGVAGRRRMEDVGTGTLKTTCDPTIIDAVELYRLPVLSKGLPLTRIPGICQTDCTLIIHKGD